jgi:hypothetical protein
MPETTAPPEQVKQPKKPIIVEAVICVLAILTTPAFLGLFLFVPMAVAYPIIIRRPKLLYIPAGLCLITIIILAAHDFAWVPFLIFLLAIFSGAGFGAGFLIRLFRESQELTRFIALIFGVGILLAPFLYVLISLLFIGI